jgi:Xaa-Pro aminopeptidase
LPDGFSFHIAPWAEPELHQTYALGAAGNGAVLSDRPQNGEGMLPAALRLRRAVLQPPEQARLRALGRGAAEAVTQALRAARANWTGYDLAAAAAGALWQRGIEPALVLAAGDSRPGDSLPALRHPLPTSAPLGRRALLAVGARRHGLYVRLTRAVVFGTLSPDEQTAQDALLHVEGTGLDAVRPGASLAAVYHALDAAYRHANRPDAIRARDQGGLVGYAPSELLASPSTATGIGPGMAFALCPAFPDAPGATVEDTFLLGAGGLENLTFDPNWPVTTIQGRARPTVLEAT